MSFSSFMPSLSLLVLIGVLGCLAHPRVSRAPMEPAQEGTRWLAGAQNVRLSFSVSGPADPWGVVYFVQGPEIRSSEPYPHLSAQLHASGIATAVLHPRGSGFSDGVRGDVDDFHVILDDLRRGLEQVRKDFPDAALFLLGHSAGAAFCLELAAKTDVRLTGVIIVNPAYKLRSAKGMGPSFRDIVSYAFNMVFRRTALTVDLNRRPELVRDPSDREAAFDMQRDPLVVRYFSMRYMLGLREVMNACVKNAGSVDAPVLLVQGARDELVDPLGNDEILAAVHATDKTKLVAPSGAHGSSAVETVVQELMRWLTAHRGRPT